MESGNAKRNGLGCSDFSVGRNAAQTRGSAKGDFQPPSTSAGTWSRADLASSASNLPTAGAVLYVLYITLILRTATCGTYVGRFAVGGWCWSVATQERFRRKRSLADVDWLQLRESQKEPIKTFLGDYSAHSATNSHAAKFLFFEIASGTLLGSLLRALCTWKMEFLQRNSYMCHDSGLINFGFQAVGRGQPGLPTVTDCDSQKLSLCWWRNCTKAEESFAATGRARRWARIGARFSASCLQIRRCVH